MAGTRGRRRPLGAAPDGTPAWPGFEDPAVPPDRLAGYIRELRRLLGDHGIRGAIYGHFGEGCLHLRAGFGLDRPGGEDRLARFMSDAADLGSRTAGR